MSRRDVYVNYISGFDSGIEALFIRRYVMGAGEGSGLIQLEAQSPGSKLDVPRGSNPCPCARHLRNRRRVYPPQGVIRNQALYDFSHTHNCIGGGRARRPYSKDLFGARLDDVR